MLVLTRKVGERLVIGSDVVITVTKINGSKVRLGIEAPKACVIWRDELVDKNAGHSVLDKIGFSEHTA